MAEQSQIYYKDDISYDEKAATKQLRPVSLSVMTALAETLSGIDLWQADKLKDALNELAESLGIGFGKIGQPLRVALTGGSASPDIADTLEMIGRERSVARVRQAITFIEQRIAAG